MAQFKVIYGTQRNGDAEPHDFKEVIVADVATMAHAAWVAAEVVYVHSGIDQGEALAAELVFVDVIRLS
jgi:hypothetical protein